MRCTSCLPLPAHSHPTTRPPILLPGTLLQHVLQLLDARLYPACSFLPIPPLSQPPIPPLTRLLTSLPLPDTLLQHVLPPVLDGTARFDAHSTRSGDSAIVKWLAITPGAPQTPSSIGRVEVDCTQLLRVLADALFRGRPTTLAAFGAAFWPGFVELYQAAFLRQLDSQGAAVLRGRQQAAVAMEGAARELGMLPEGGTCGEALGVALGRAVQRSYHAAQQEYLARAREAAARAGPGAVAVTVGVPLPLDAAFYQRYKDKQVKVCVVWGTWEGGWGWGVRVWQWKW